MSGAPRRAHHATPQIPTAPPANNTWEIRYSEAGAAWERRLARLLPNSRAVPTKLAKALSKFPSSFEARRTRVVCIHYLEQPTYWHGAGPTLGMKENSGKFNFTVTIKPITTTNQAHVPSLWPTWVVPVDRGRRGPGRGRTSLIPVITLLAGLSGCGGAGRTRPPTAPSRGGVAPRRRAKPRRRRRGRHGQGEQQGQAGAKTGSLRGQTNNVRESSTA